MVYSKWKIKCIGLIIRLRGTRKRIPLYYVYKDKTFAVYFNYVILLNDIEIDIHNYTLKDNYYRI